MLWIRGVAMYLATAFYQDNFPKCNFSPIWQIVFWHRPWTVSRQTAFWCSFRWGKREGTRKPKKKNTLGGSLSPGSSPWEDILLPLDVILSLSFYKLQHKMGTPKKAFPKVLVSSKGPLNKLQEPLTRPQTKDREPLEKGSFNKW